MSTKKSTLILNPIHLCEVNLLKVLLSFSEKKQATTKWIIRNNCIFTVTCKTVKNNLKTIHFDGFCLLGRLRWFEEAQEKAAILTNSLLCLYGVSP